MWPQLYSQLPTMQQQCSQKTFMVYQTFVWWALYILFKFVRSLIRHLAQAIGNVLHVWWFSWTLQHIVRPWLALFLLSSIQQSHLIPPQMRLARSGTIFCFLLGVSSGCAQPITGQVTEITCPVIGQAQPELTRSKRQIMAPWFMKPLGSHWPVRVFHAPIKFLIYSLIARLMGPTWGPPGADRTQVGPMWALKIAFWIASLGSTSGVIVHGHWGRGIGKPLLVFHVHISNAFISISLTHLTKVSRPFH